jgi:ferredoxin
MHVHINQETCMGHGQCVLLVAEVFRMGPNDVAELIVEEPDESLRSRLEEVVQYCPTGSISLH